MSAAAAAADATIKKSGGMKKIILMAAIALLVLGGVGVGLVVYLNKQRAAAEAAAEDGDAPAAASEHKARKDRTPPTFVPMENFVVNLADHDADRYAQIGVTLEVGDEKGAEEIKSYMPAIRNNVLLLLAHKSSADLAGSEGKEKLAREIRREALRAMGEELPDEDTDAGAASAPKAKKKKKVDDAALPIRAVQFSSFIIQ